MSPYDETVLSTLWGTKLQASKNVLLVGLSYSWPFACLVKSWWDQLNQIGKTIHNNAEGYSWGDRIIWSSC